MNYWTGLGLVVLGQAFWWLRLPGPGSSLLAGGLLALPGSLLVLWGSGGGPARPARPLALRREQGLFLMALGVAVFFRFWKLGSLRQNLWYDEAVIGNAVLDDVLSAGQAPLFIPEVPGPGMFFWIAAVFFRLFGADGFTLALLSAVLGTLSLVPLYFIGRRWFGPRPALVGLALAACMRWSFSFHRIGFGQALAQFWVLLAFYFFWKAWEKGRTADWTCAGLCLGASFHTYLPSILAVPLLFGFLFTQALLGRSIPRRGFLVFLGAWLLSAGPLAWFAWKHWDLFQDRGNAVSLVREIHSRGWGVLAGNLADHLKMFQFQGDSNGRHNLPFMPQLDPLCAALFLPALLLLNARCLKDPRASFMAWWFWLMLAAGALTLSAEAPQANRTILLVPLVPLAIMLLLEGRPPLPPAVPAKKKTLTGAVLALLLAAAALNYHEYFVSWGHHVGVWWDFSPKANAMARRLKAQDRGWSLKLSPLPNQYGFFGGESAEIARFVMRGDGRAVETLKESGNTLDQEGALGVLCVWGAKDAGFTQAARRQFPDLAIEAPSAPFPKVDMLRLLMQRHDSRQALRLGELPSAAVGQAWRNRYQNKAYEEKYFDAPQEPYDSPEVLYYALLVPRLRVPVVSRDEAVRKGLMLYVERR